MIWTGLPASPATRRTQSQTKSTQSKHHNTKQDCGNLPERVVALIAHEVVKVVEACHARSILHGDIKVSAKRAGRLGGFERAACACVLAQYVVGWAPVRAL